MPPPTNIDAANAVNITVLPYSITQDVFDAGTTYTVWYKYTATFTGMLGIYGLGDLVTYKPTLRIFGPNDSTLSSGLSDAQNRPAQLYVTTGETWFFRFTTNAGNPNPANLQVSVLALTTQEITLGSLLINDDTPGFPGIILSASDGTVINTAGIIAAGEYGDAILSPTPYYALTDIDDFTVKVYNQSFSLLSTIVPLGGQTDEALIRANRTLGLIYIASKNGSDNWVLQSIDSSGTASAALSTITIGLSSTFVKSMALNNTGTKVYINNLNIIKVWDIAGSSFDADLLTGPVNHSPMDILVLSDNTILIIWVLSATGSVQVGHYSSLGAQINLWDYGTGNETTLFQHIALAIPAEELTYFFLWTHPNNAGTSRFRKVQISDGVTVLDYTIPEFETGVYNPGATDTPTARFGPSASCPFFLLADINTPNPLSGIYQIVPDKRNDTLWVSFDPEETEDVAIPDPFFKTGLIGK